MNNHFNRNEIRLSPCQSVGPFNFGSSLSEVFNYIRKNTKDFKKNEFKYNEVDPLSMPYVIHLQCYGIELRFNPKSQRLFEIKICDLQKTHITYGIDRPVPLSSPNNIPTLNTIHEIVGPTVPGKNEGNYFIVEYKDAGLEFIFNNPRNENNNEGNNQPYILKHIICKTDIENIEACRNIHATIGKGITFLPEGLPKHDSDIQIKNCQSLCFGSSVQEVLSVLGIPQQKYYKYNEPFINMKNSLSPDSFISTVHDYFFNYFYLGMDILFDGRLHTVKKFILNTNMPTYNNFTTYSKCQFVLHIKDDNQEEIDGGDDQININNNEQEIDNKKITCDDKFSRVKEIMGEPEGKPFEWHLANTEFYGYKDVVFEVMKNDYISRVILFKGSN